VKRGGGAIEKRRTSNYYRYLYMWRGKGCLNYKLGRNEELVKDFEVGDGEGLRSEGGWLRVIYT
jgi:hypothetical protein